MPFSFINALASWILKKRHHQIDLFLKYPIEVQQEVLLNLIQTAQNTEVGVTYRFNEIIDYKSFVERVPLKQYEDIEPLITRTRNGEQNLFWPTPIQWFAKSSGTTNA
ncbi:MAG: GH3 auxin-responsive promoter family protein, partial [Zetaproteobacteria bacterium]|nr:GH3 auxin-responsive promoter family protein [Flavobacteriales bacterium]